MSANTETTGADRTKCKAWCGKAYGARGVPFRRSCGFPMYFEHGADFNVAVKDGEPTWCSPACRDARLPPIAAPAAHVERRRGQPDGYCGKEHESIFGPFTCNRTDLHAASDCKWRADMWSPPLPVAAAPPEPATVRCAPHGAVASLCIQCKALGKSPPAQEAPKAAPVCCDPFSNSVHHVEVLKRTWKTASGDGTWSLRTDWLCSLCLSENEPGGGGSDVLHNDDTPERLPKPQLAADWVEDCLEDA